MDAAQAAYQEEYTKENRAKAEQYENTLANTSALTAAIGTATAIKSGKILDADASNFGQALTTAGTAVVGYGAA